MSENNVNPRIEEEINNWVQRKGIANEQKALMKECIEAVEHEMAKEGLSKYSFELPVSKEIVTITRREKDKKKLDKTGLADEIEVDKSDLTVAGMIKLTEEDKLTTQHLQRHTYNDKKVEIKVKIKAPKESK